ncbi:MAG: hypothetical protein WCH34_09285 [Bacteroidota bacterium]
MNKNEHEYLIEIAKNNIGNKVFYSKSDKQGNQKEYIFEKYSGGIGIAEPGKEMKFSNVFAHLKEIKTKKVKKVLLKQVIKQNKLK